MRSRTIHNVQYLRFFAASAVLFSHTADLVVSHYSPVWKVPWTAGVDVFFVIRGFIMTWLTRGRFGAPDAPLRYLLSRIIRIAPPYWFFTAVMVAAVLLAPEQVRNTRLGWTELITSALFIAWPALTGTCPQLSHKGGRLTSKPFSM